MSARAARLATELRERELDALLITTPVNVRYMTGYTGSNGLALVAVDEDPQRPANRFYTDFRYATQSAEQVPQDFQREIVDSGDLLAAAAATLAEQLAGQKVGFEASHLTVERHTRLRGLAGENVSLIECVGAVENLRAIKDTDEIARIRAASELADDALRRVLERGLLGRTEQEVAIDLETQMRGLGAAGPSFPSIVASGAHGALPHAEPRAEPIARDVLVTIDWGAYHDGYCSDCTRTFATGENLSGGDREIYELVRSAQAEAVEAVRAGETGRELDAVARAIIDAAGYEEHFGHGLGHGVGMEIHEGPRLSRTAGDDPLRAGNVVTVEPGVYLPGQCGVRIEDLLLVTPEGHEVLTGLPRELTVVS